MTQDIEEASSDNLVDKHFQKALTQRVPGAHDIDISENMFPTCCCVPQAVLCSLASARRQAE